MERGKRREQEPCREKRDRHTVVQTLWGQGTSLRDTAAPNSNWFPHTGIVFEWEVPKTVVQYNYLIIQTYTPVHKVESVRAILLELGVPKFEAVLRLGLWHSPKVWPRHFSKPICHRKKGLLIDVIAILKLPQNLDYCCGKTSVDFPKLSHFHPDILHMHKPHPSGHPRNLQRLSCLTKLLKLLCLK